MCGRSSPPRRRSRSGSCRSIRVRVSAGTASRSIPPTSSWQVRRDAGHQFRVLEEAEDINAQMPSWVTGRIAEALNDRGKAVKDAKIFVLGVAYKPDVGDIRESPSVKIINQLHKRGALLAFHDPYVDRVAMNGGTLHRTEPHERRRCPGRPGRRADPAQRLRPGVGGRAREAGVRRAERVRVEHRGERGAAVRFGNDTRFRHASDALYRRVGVDVLVTRPGDPQMHELSGGATAVWDGLHVSPTLPGARGAARSKARGGGAADRGSGRGLPRDARAWGSSRRLIQMADEVNAVEAMARGVAAFGRKVAPPTPTGGALSSVVVVLARIAFQRLTGLAVDSAAAGSLRLSDVQATALLAEHRRAMAWCLVVERKLVGLADAFDAEGIGFAVLKGASVAHTMYPETYLRSFADVDLLVSTADYERACRLLEHLGHMREAARAPARVRRPVRQGQRPHAPG